jgi:hypothetical protein
MLIRTVKRIRPPMSMEVFSSWACNLSRDVGSLTEFDPTSILRLDSAPLSLAKPDRRNLRLETRGGPVLNIRLVGPCRAIEIRTAQNI